MTPGSTALGRILLVDDDASVRRLLSRLLALEGYDVVTAIDGLDALSLTNQDPRFDLVITDVVMPRLDGLSLAECLQSARPTLKVLLMSGYSDVLVERALDAGTPFVGKPIDIPQFLASVRRLLNRTTDGSAPAAEGEGP